MDVLSVIRVRFLGPLVIVRSEILRIRPVALSLLLSLVVLGWFVVCELCKLPIVNVLCDHLRCRCGRMRHV